MAVYGYLLDFVGARDHAEMTQYGSKEHSRGERSLPIDRDNEAAFHVYVADRQECDLYSSHYTNRPPLIVFSIAPSLTASRRRTREICLSSISVSWRRLVK